MQSFLEISGLSRTHLQNKRKIIIIQVMQEFDTVWQYVQNDGLPEEIKNNVSDGDKVNNVAKQFPELLKN